ncbi:MAG: hypothetical protein EOP84_03680 [Verrucomicrobiaceae bacterium]|nr:MAG: hypothetical protein EOP84_03680 [Verrucomicrobiaceae bacterium]
MAHIIHKLCSQWGAEQSVHSVHGFAREVATCLLHYDDVEIGELRDGRFLLWSLPAWDADQKIDAELMAMETLLSDESQYIFRKKPML